MLAIIVSVFVLQKTRRKGLSLLSAFFVNAIIIFLAAWLSYQMNEEARIFGTGYTDLFLLVFSLPVLTWLNFFVIQYVEKSK